MTTSYAAFFISLSITRLMTTLCLCFPIQLLVVLSNSSLMKSYDTGWHADFSISLLFNKKWRSLFIIEGLLICDFARMLPGD